MTKTDWAVVIAAAMAVVGCGPTDKNKDGLADKNYDPTKVTLNAPSTPTGSISGQVLTTARVPLAGATVSVNVAQAPLQTTTDANGVWSFQALPGGSQVMVSITKQGFTSLRTLVQVPDNIAGVPVSNGNGFAGQWMLVPTTGNVQFQIFASDGTPAKGAQATLEVSPTALQVSGYGIIPFPNGIQAVATATANDQGVVSFTGVPDPGELFRAMGLFGSTQYQLTVAALDQNGDGIPDSAGLVTSYSAGSLYLATSRTVVVMKPAQVGQGPFQLVSSTVGSLLNPYSPPQLNLLKPSDAITLVFSHQIQPGSLLVRVTDEYGIQQVSTNPPTINGQVITIQPANGALIPGQEYNLQVHAVSLQSGAQLDFVGYFFTGDPATPVPLNIARVAFHDGSNGYPKDGLLNPGEDVDLVFNQPVGYFGWLSPSGSMAVAYFNYDLDGSGTIGDAYGEKGTTQGGFYIYPNEPTNETNTLFMLVPSNYTTRWYLFYPWWNFGFYANLPATVEVDIDFSSSSWTDSTTGVQTIWGTPLLSTMRQVLTQATP